MSAKHAETIVESGTEIFIPLNKLKKSPKNARKTPHSGAAIEAYAASIAAKGILQNLVVEPELDSDGTATAASNPNTSAGSKEFRTSRRARRSSSLGHCLFDQRCRASGRRGR
jgi:ParB family chromosome partitioning protein